MNIEFRRSIKFSFLKPQTGYFLKKVNIFHCKGSSCQKKNLPGSYYNFSTTDFPANVSDTLMMKAKCIPGFEGPRHLPYANVVCDDGFWEVYFQCLRMYDCVI